MGVTEQQPFRVLQKFPEFEVREYPDYVLVQVEVAGDFMSAGNVAFGPLVRYISGNNESGQRMAMTAPVLQSTRESSTHTVSFVLPEGMDPASIPVPRDARVRVLPVSGHRAAVRPFRGSWRQSRFADNAQTLRQAVNQAGLKTEGDPYFARFDPPWTPGFMKRNEVLLRLTHA